MNDIKKQIDGLINKWMSHFILCFMDYPGQAGIKLFAKIVLPAFKRES